MTVILIAFTFAGLLIAGLSIPLIQRRIAPNELYGLRVRATFEDEWVWYEANALTGRDLLIVGVAVTGVALLLPTLGVSEKAYAITMVTLLLGGVIVAAVSGWRRANRLLALRRASANQTSASDQRRP